MQLLKSTTTHTQRVDVRIAVHWQLLAFNSIVYYVIIYSLWPSTGILFRADLIDPYNALLGEPLHSPAA